MDEDKAASPEKQPNANDQSPLVQIVNWTDTFERLNSPALDIADSPRLLNLMLSAPDTAAIFGILMLIVGICRRHPEPRDGWLTENGQRKGPRFTLETLAGLFHRPQIEILRCFQCTTTREVAFMRFVEGDYMKLHELFVKRDRTKWA
jgi:hypothetical protein